MNPSVTDFILSLLNIVFLDLILAGDNAIVIGLAARNLQGSSQKKAILLGTGGAVVLRIIATILVVWLLKVPWLLLFGGLLLIMIAYRSLTGEIRRTRTYRQEEHCGRPYGRSLSQTRRWGWIM